MSKRIFRKIFRRDITLNRVKKLFKKCKCQKTCVQPKVLNSNNDTLLHVVLKNPSCTEEIVQELIDRGVDLHHQNNDGRTPLHAACMQWHCSVSVIRPLLQKKASPKAKDKFGNTPLHYFVKSRSPNIDIIQELLTYGAIVNDFNNKIQTPLHVASKSLVLDGNVIRELLRLGSDPNSKDQDGNVPLHYFVRVKWTNDFHLKQLINYGADVNSLNLSRMTPLHVATQRKHFTFSIVRELLQCGANPNLCDTSGNMSVHHAVNTICNLHIPLPTVCKLKQDLFPNGSWRDLLNLLLEYGANINALGRDNYTALQQVVSEFDNYMMPVLDELLKKGAHINNYAEAGSTALHLAVNRDLPFYPLIRKLLHNNADPTWCDYQNREPLVCFAEKLPMFDDNYSEALMIFKELLHATPLYNMSMINLELIFQFISSVPNLKHRCKYRQLIVKHYVIAGIEWCFLARCFVRMKPQYKSSLMKYKNSCIFRLSAMSQYLLCTCSSHNPPACCRGIPAVQLLQYGFFQYRYCSPDLTEQILFMLAKYMFSNFWNDILHSIPTYALVAAVRRRGFWATGSNNKKVCLNTECLMKIASFSSKKGIFYLLRALGLRGPVHSKFSRKRKHSEGHDEDLFQKHVKT